MTNYCKMMIVGGLAGGALACAWLFYRHINGDKNGDNNEQTISKKIEKR